MTITRGQNFCVWASATSSSAKGGFVVDEYLGLARSFRMAQVEPSYGLTAASWTQNKSACSTTVHGGGKLRGDETNRTMAWP
jgi:hypothetical protein